MKRQVPYARQRSVETEEQDGQTTATGCEQHMCFRLNKILLCHSLLLIDRPATSCIPPSPVRRFLGGDQSMVALRFACLLAWYLHGQDILSPETHARCLLTERRCWPEKFNPSVWPVLFPSLHGVRVRSGLNGCYAAAPSPDPEP